MTAPRASALAREPSVHTDGEGGSYSLSNPAPSPCYGGMNEGVQ
jgi:hypothetical protein